MEGEMTVVPQGFDLAVGRSPNAVLAEAQTAAKALKGVLDALPEDKKVMMGGEQYIEFDHWQLIGRFYGCSVKVVNTEYVEIGTARGFVSRSVVLDPSGREISAADAMCLNDEEKWTARPKYEWQYVKKSGGLSSEDPGKDEIIWEKVGEKSRPKKERVRTGDVAVPLNQLRSMAQTRSSAKAYRNVFSWVVVLAGYAPTPAEELTGHEVPPEQEAAPQATITRKPESQLPPKSESIIAMVTEVKKKTINTRNGAKPKFVVYTSAGENFETWDEALAKTANAAKDMETRVRIGFTKNQYGNQLVGIAPEGEQVGE